MQKETFIKAKYIKDNGEESDRYLYILKMPNDLLEALDVTGLTSEQAEKAVEMYKEWVKTDLKEYNAKVKELKKDLKFPSFQEFLVARGIPEVQAKNFHLRGIKPNE